AAPQPGEGAVAGAQAELELGAADLDAEEHALCRGPVPVRGEVGIPLAVIDPRPGKTIFAPPRLAPGLQSTFTAAPATTRGHDEDHRPGVPGAGRVEAV